MIKIVPAVERRPWNAEFLQRAAHRQMGLLDELDDLQFFASRSCRILPIPGHTFLSRRFSRRQSSAMLSSPRRPSGTMRIFSSSENCRRVTRRMSFTTFFAGSFTGADFRWCGTAPLLQRLSAKAWLLINNATRIGDRSMKQITTVGLDLAKHVFQVHGAEVGGPCSCSQAAAR